MITHYFCRHLNLPQGENELVRRGYYIGEEPYVPQSCPLHKQLYHPMRKVATVLAKRRRAAPAYQSARAVCKKLGRSIAGKREESEVT